MKKKDQIKFCQSIIASGTVSQTDLPTLISILSQHSEWEEKIGYGMSHISIGKAQFGTKCFYINRMDGSKTDISFHHAISPRTELAKIKLACRHAISKIIAAKKCSVVFGVETCPFTKEILLPHNTHIDHHDLTFAELFNLWYKDQDHNRLVAAINPTEDNNTHTYFTDNQIVQDFTTFHNANTHLRAVSSYANLSILRTV